jgi:hypothetical protein
MRFSVIALLSSAAMAAATPAAAQEASIPQAQSDNVDPLAGIIASVTIQCPAPKRIASCNSKGANCNAVPDRKFNSQLLASEKNIS